MPAMPPVNVEDSAQNAFVQSWLSAWAKAHTVYGSDNWESAAREKIAADPGHAKTWNRTVDREVEDAALFESVVELIQETYDYTDHEARDAASE